MFHGPLEVDELLRVGESQEEQGTGESTEQTGVQVD